MCIMPFRKFCPTQGSQKELIVKFVKGTIIFLVLCLAAYGAFALLKPSPRTDLTDNELQYLQSIGINVQGGRAADSGLSAVLGDVDGLEPIGTGMDAPPNSAPPSFLTVPSDSAFAPAFVDSALRLASSCPDQPVPESFTPAIDVLPPPNFTEPVNPPVQSPPIETPLFEEVPASEPPPVLPAESPPPWEKNWDGPASDLTRTPPPLGFLPPLDTPPNPAATTLRNIQSPADENIVYPSGRENVHRIDNNVRTIVLVSASQEDPFSSTDSVPINAAPVFPAPVHPVPAYPTPVRYTSPPARQQLMFEPIKPESPPNTPSVAFAPPKRTHKPQQPEQTLQQASLPLTTPSLTTNVAVKQIGTPRIIERPVESPYSVLPPAVQPSIQEASKRFIQSQQQAAESGDPQNIRLAFVQLSKLYEHNQLGEAERTMILPILDPLARTVIYARDTHILESPYRVKPGETVESIAQNFNLTPVLLRKINGLTMSQTPAAGTTLKVVEGQFDARISVQRKELTLLLGGLYAGRFSFTFPHAGIPAQRGEFYVTHCTGRMITLNNGWTLATAQVRDATVVFTDHDAGEIFDILSTQSVIVVE
jgi:LysM repeat protein